MPHRSPAARSLFVDTLKATASLLIVAHHLAFYGPMADLAAPLAPDLFAFLADQARMVVQVFLVIGGFMAARVLAPEGYLVTSDPLQALAQRAARLVVPFWFAVGLTLAASNLAGHWMDHGSLTPMPGALDLLLNLTLLAQIFGRDGLTAGAWYVGIDLQLFALTTGIFALAAGLSGRRRRTRGARALGMGLFALLTLAAWFHFNLDPSGDAWAPYFMGAYGLGALAWWCSAPGRSRAWFVTVALVALLALQVAWRDRLALALATAALLYLWRRLQQRAVATPTGPGGVLGSMASLAASLGQRSYALFLVHFPVCLLINGLFAAFLPETPVVQGLGVAAALAASVAAARVFYDWVEAPVLALTRSPRPARLASDVAAA